MYLRNLFLLKFNEEKLLSYGVIPPLSSGIQGLQREIMNTRAAKGDNKVITYKKDGVLLHLVTVDMV